MPEKLFTVPLPVQDEQSIIWRYIDFTKFVSLLDKSSLFLCRADMLDDPFEGSSPEPDVDAWKRDYYRRKILERSIGYAKMQADLEDISKGIELLKRFVHISSWFMNEYESAAMWKLYTRTNEAVAIKTTYKRLSESLPNCDSLLIGKVIYLDYKKNRMDEKQITDRFFYKRKSYEHEEEVRVVLFNLSEELPSSISATETEGGVYIKTQIDTLIDKVYVAPNSPNWFKELVEHIVNLYGVHKEVIRTSLDDKALY